jgi:hypothetical protein
VYAKIVEENTTYNIKKDGWNKVYAMTVERLYLKTIHIKDTASVV